MADYRFIYDGLSLPMVQNVDTGEVFRIQRLERGNWRTIETEVEYFVILGVMKNGGES